MMDKNCGQKLFRCCTYCPSVDRFCTSTVGSVLNNFFRAIKKIFSRTHSNSMTDRPSFVEFAKHNQDSDNLTNFECQINPFTISRKLQVLQKTVTFSGKLQVLKKTSVWSRSASIDANRDQKYRLVLSKSTRKRLLLQLLLLLRLLVL